MKKHPSVFLLHAHNNAMSITLPLIFFLTPCYISQDGDSVDTCDRILENWSHLKYIEVHAYICYQYNMYLQVSACNIVFGQYCCPDFWFKGLKFLNRNCVYIQYFFSDYMTLTQVSN